jgi:hypothetical protein
VGGRLSEDGYGAIFDHSMMMLQMPRFPSEANRHLRRTVHSADPEHETAQEAPKKI